MKKNYFSFLFATLMLFVAMPAKAQVSSFADLCGKYQFSADMEVTDDGQSYADKFTDNCEVTIVEDKFQDFIGRIDGFAGLSGKIYINSIDVAANTITIATPNQMMGAEALYLNDLDGSKKIFGDDQYGNLVYTYNPETKVFTLPDFSLVTKFFDNDNKDNPDNNKVDKIVAKFTNVTLTLIAAEDNEPEFSWEGTYTVTAGEIEEVNDTYTYPSTFEMEIIHNDRGYFITKFFGQDTGAPLNYAGGIEVRPFADKPNQAEIIIPYNAVQQPSTDTYLSMRDEELSNTNSVIITLEEDGTLTFEDFTICEEVWNGGGLASETLAATYKNVTATKNSDEDNNEGEGEGNEPGTGEGEGEGEGNEPGTGEGEEEETIDWVGTYTVTVGEVETENNTYTYPSTFEMVITNTEYGFFTITKFLGQNVDDLNYQGGGGIKVKNLTDNPNQAEISTVGYYVQEISETQYTCMRKTDLSDEPLLFTRNTDDTYTIEDFAICSITYNPDFSITESLVAKYKNITVTKKATPTAIENTNVENKAVVGIFDLLGRKLDAITGPGLYIVNGKKVVIK